MRIILCRDFKLNIEIRYNEIIQNYSGFMSGYLLNRLYLNFIF